MAPAQSSLALPSTRTTSARPPIPSVGAPAILRVNPLDDADWNARLADFADASVFHTVEWLHVLQRAYNFAPCYFVEKDRHRHSAILPLLEVDSWLTGRRGVCLPFTDECQPLALQCKAFEDVFSQACAYGRSRRWKSLEVRGASPFLSGTPSISFFGHHLTLHPDLARLLAGFTSATRRAIRKAEQNGVTVELRATREAMRTFYELMCVTRRRHGLPPAPYRFFEHLRTLMLAGGHGCVALARHHGVPIAGAVFLRFQDRVVYKYGASDEQYQHLRGNNLVMWQAIRHYATLGFKSLDLGRTSLTNTGLRSFKLGWGTREYAIRYQKYDFRAEAFVSERDRSSGWHTRLFRLLPSSINRLIGAAVYQHIA